jgi:hypothetical protein
VLQTFVVALLLYFHIFIKQQFMPASHKCTYFVWVVNIAMASLSVLYIYIKLKCSRNDFLCEIHVIFYDI